MMKIVVVCLSLVCALPLAAQNTPEACSNITLGTNGALNGFVPSPDDAWHQDISQSAVDAKSDTIINTVGDLGGAKLHPDFSSIAGGSYGIPYNVIDSSKTGNTPITVNMYGNESDLSSIPAPATMSVEGGLPSGCSTPSTDHHAIVIDRKGCVVYELWQATKCNSGYNASTSSMWDMLGVEKRPWTYTSVDAAGLSVFEGLIRYDEILTGEINHAIRFTAQKSKSDANIGYFTPPATHAAGNYSKSDNIMGMRIRLKANFDISGYSTTNQIILKAMKKYGMIFADNGSNLYFQGTPDARWNDSDLHNLTGIPATAFEVVQMGPIYQSTTVPTGSAPKINSFKASATYVSPGDAVTLTPDVTGASYSYIDSIGLVRGAITVNPAATTTYKLTSRNAYGTTSASVTVSVGASPAVTPTLTFAPIAAHKYGDAPFAVSATSASPAPVTYAVSGGPATISGNIVTLTGVGSVTLKAAQVASGSYNATSMKTTFAVNAADPGLTFTSISAKTYPSANFTVATTTRSGGSISYAVTSGPATINGNTLTLTGVGTVVLTANQAAAGNYIAGSASTSFNVTGAVGTTRPTLTPPPIYGVVYGTGAFSAVATSNSTGAITYSITSGPATINGSSVTPTAVGTIVILVSQASTSTYAAASKTFSVVVKPANPNLTIPQMPDVIMGTPLSFTATSLSGAPITYSIAAGVGSILSNVLSPTTPGKFIITATQPAWGNYAAASYSMGFHVLLK